MPVYEYRCPEGCDDYEIWRTISERNVSTDCPSCGSSGIRLFHPLMSLTGSLRLKQASSEPKVVTSRPKQEEPRAQIKESTNRPWMLNRGC